MGVVIPGNELGRNRNTRRRLDLVTGQHPNLDARIPQKFQHALDLSSTPVKPSSSRSFSRHSVTTAAITSFRPSSCTLAA